MIEDHRPSAEPVPQLRAHLDAVLADRKTFSAECGAREAERPLGLKGLIRQRVMATRTIASFENDILDLKRRVQALEAVR